MLTDTHESFKTLITSGFTEAQTEVILHSLTMNHLAKKEDTRGIEKGIDSIGQEIDKLKSRFEMMQWRWG